jgi:hypothetical protein
MRRKRQLFEPHSTASRCAFGDPNSCASIHFQLDQARVDIYCCSMMALDTRKEETSSSCRALPTALTYLCACGNAHCKVPFRQLCSYAFFGSIEPVQKSIVGSNARWGRGPRYRSVNAISSELEIGLNRYLTIDFEPVTMLACTTMPGVMGRSLGPVPT